MARDPTRKGSSCPRPRTGTYTSRMATQGKGPARTFLLILLVASLVIVALIIRPFAGALFLAAVLAVTFHPWYWRLVQKPHGPGTLAAGLITLGPPPAPLPPVRTLVVLAARGAAGRV